MMEAVNVSQDTQAAIVKVRNFILFFLNFGGH